MLKNIFAVLKGTVVAQAINILTIPILTRLYGPEAFGQLQLYQSILVPILVLITMRYELAILWAGDGDELSAVLHLCLGIAVFVSLLVGVTGGILAPILLKAGRIPAGFGALLMAGSLFGGLFQVLGYLSVRFHAFRIGAISKVSQSAVSAGTSMAVAWIKPWSGALIIGDVLGRLIGSIAFFPHRGGMTRSLVARPSTPAMAAAARKYWSLPAVSVPGGLINAAGGVLTPLAMFSYFSPAIAGQFSIVERCIIGPLGILGVAISQVFMAELAVIVRKRQSGIVDMFLKILRRTLLVGGVIAVPCAIFAPYATQLIFGSQWAMAGTFARLLTPLFAVSLAASSVTMTLSITGNQQLQFVWECARLTAILSVWVAVYVWHMSTGAAVAMHGAVITFMYVIYFFICLYALRRCDREALLESL